MISGASLMLGALLRPIMLHIPMAEAVFCFGKPALPMGEFEEPFLQLTPESAVTADEIISGIRIRCSLKLIEKVDCSFTPRRIGSIVVKWNVPHALLASRQILFLNQLAQHLICEFYLLSDLFLTV
jgi:hypothetical protein